VADSGYKLSEGEPSFHYLEVKDGMKEKELLDELISKLQFEEIIIAQAFALVSPKLAENYSNLRRIQKTRMKSDPASFFGNNWINNEDRVNVIEVFKQKMESWTWNKDLSIEDSVILPMVHSTEEKIAWSIAASGFAALAALDAGFYGKGIYFSSSALYTIPYFATKKEPTILICLTAPGNPFPVIEHPKEDNNLFGKLIKPGYQSHYVLTSKSGNPWTEKNGPKNRYDELVLDLEAQVVPLFLLKIDKSNFPQLLEDFKNMSDD